MMEVVLIPDIYRIMSTSYQTIDTFATWCEDLEVHFNCTKTDFPTSKIQYIMKRLTDYKPNTVIPQVNRLFYILTETILNMVASEQTRMKTAKSYVGQIRNKWKKLTSSSNEIRPIQTFDETTILQHYNETRQLKKLIDEHHKVYTKVQKQQEECWIAKSKVTKYELCLLTAKKSRCYMSDKLPAKELKKRDNAIDQLQDILNTKVKKAADASSLYRSLLTKESSVRLCIKQLEQKIVGDIMFGLTDRVKSGLSSLKQILNHKSGTLLSQISDDSDCRCFAAAIIDTLSFKYTCFAPQAFHEENGFSVRLPNPILTHHKDNLTELNTTQQSTNNNNDSRFDFNFQNNQHLTVDSLIDNKSLCFVKLTKGMTVKQKISTDSSDVVFGWFKGKPWQQKSWGFFQKDMNVIIPV